MLRSGNAKTALVIGAETFSRILDWEDRATCVLFGDGAGALVLRAEDGEAGILATKLHADGRTMICSSSTAGLRRPGPSASCA